MGLVGCLAWVLLVAAGGYAAARFAVPYLDYWRFKDAMTGQAEAAEKNSDEEIREFLAETAARLEIPLAPRDIRVRRERGRIAISAAWREQVVLPKLRRTLHFQPQVSARLSTAQSP